MAASFPLPPLSLGAPSLRYQESPTAPTVYEYPGGLLELIPQYEGFTVRITNQSAAFTGRGTVTLETSLPAQLIHRIASICGLSEAARIINRHQDPDEVLRTLNRQLESYFPRLDFAGKVFLDFGCGTGASSRALAWLQPGAEVIGVDCDAVQLDLARAIVEAFPPAPDNLSFVQSPSRLSLPPDLPTIDFVVMSAAFHHLHPAERRLLLPLLWKLLRPGGALLFSESPHRWRTLASAVLPQNWRSLIADGLPSASEREILHLLPATAEVLTPAQAVSRADYWRQGQPDGPSPWLWAVKGLFRRTERYWGVVPSSHLDLVIRKHG